MMTIPKVKNAAFGLSLETGAKIIAFLHLVLYALFFILAIVEERDYTHVQQTYSNDSSTNSSGNATESMEDEVLRNAYLELSASYFNDFALLVQITFASFLVLGLYKKNIDFILSWVLLQIANIIFSLFFITVYFVAVFNVVSHYLTYLLCEEITVTLVAGYCILVVNSYVEELTNKGEDREEQMEPIVTNTPDSPGLTIRSRR